MVLVPDEMVTIDPPPPAAITGMAWRASRRAPRVVMSSARSQTPRSTPTASVSRRGWLQAALWSTRRTVPNCGDGALDEGGDGLLAADVAVQADARPPAASTSAATEAAPSVETSPTTTAAPSAASRSAVARPMSEAPPLTRTILPSSCPPSGVMGPS